VQGDSETKETVLVNSSTGTGLGTSSRMPRWGGLMKANDGGRCFYCGREGHFVPECSEVKVDVEGGWVDLDSAGKLRLADGSYIPNMPNASTLKERVERYYAEKRGQYVANEEEDDDVLYVVRPSSPFSYPSQYSYVAEDPIDQEVYLEPALDLEEGEKLSQYVCEEGEKIYAPYVAISKSSSPYYYERATWDEDLDPDLTDLLEVQFEPERENYPSQHWLDMEGNERNLPVDFTTQCSSESSPTIFEPDDPVFRIDWKY